GEDALRPLLEAVVHAVEGQEELRQIGQEAEAERAVEDPERERARLRRDLEREAPRVEVRLQEPAERARVEEAQEPIRRLQEVERVAGGRSVEDDEVEALVRRELEQLLHRHVLVTAGEGGGDVLVEAVLEDAPLRGR